jgi:hypothetical protein
MLAVVVLALFCLAGFAQRGQQRPATPAATGPFDPRDFSGFYLRDGPRPNDPPALTQAAVAAMEGRRPDYKVRMPNEQNDPMYTCNPQGFPRIVWEENEPLEFVHTPDRIIQLFQWDRTLREIWLDGRELPSGENLDNLGPAWYGHSVGRWEGDTLVVNTTGFDERMWLDEYAHPISFDARVEERYRRIDADTIEGRVTIHDPKNFAAPWTHNPPSYFRRMAPYDVEFFGWKGLFSGVTDAICAPMNELDDFNKRIRDPAITGVTP